MNLVDSCGWLEYFANGTNAEFFAPAIESTEQLIVPSLSLYEVFKRVLQQRSEGDALRAIGLMRQGRVIDLDDTFAMTAAKVALDCRLALADAIIYTTARQHHATLWTQDAHFEALPGVRYRPAKQ